MRVSPSTITQPPPAETSPAVTALVEQEPAQSADAGLEVMRGTTDAFKEALRWGPDDGSEPDRPRLLPTDNILLADTVGDPKKVTGPSPGAAKGALADAKALALLSPKAQLGYVQQLRQKNPAAFEALVTALRDGTVSDKKIALAVSIELAASTPWGKSGEGKAVLGQVRTMFEQGKVAFGKVPGNNLGFTKPDKASDGAIGGKGTGSVMTLSEGLAGTPEGLASVLAHEGVHALQYAKGKTPLSALESETAGNLVGARVWAEFGSQKEPVADKAAAGALRTIKDDAAVFDIKQPASVNQRRMELNVATEYAYSHAKAHTKSRYAEAGGMIEHILQRPDIKDVLKEASDSQIKRLFFAYETFIKALPPDTLASDADLNLKTLAEEVDRRHLR